MENLTLLEYDNLRETALNQCNRLRASNDKIKIVYVVANDVCETMIRADSHLKLIAANGYTYVVFDGCPIYIANDTTLVRNSSPSMFFPAVVEHPDYIYAELSGYYQGLQIGDTVCDNDGNLYVLTEILPHHIFTSTGVVVSMIGTTDPHPFNNTNDYMWIASIMEDNNKRKKTKQKTEEMVSCDTKELDNFLSEFVKK